MTSDQPIFNEVLKDKKILYLPYAFNLIAANFTKSGDYSDEELYKAAKNVQIVHFVNYKPWLKLKYANLSALFYLFSFTNHCKKRYFLGSMQNEFWKIASKLRYFKGLDKKEYVKLKIKKELTKIGIK